MSEQELEVLYKRLDKIENTLSEVSQLLSKLEGAGTFVKLCFYVAAPAVGAILWIKDHVTW